MSQLEPGIYLIITKKGNSVGRYHAIEDRSILPKPVLVLPDGLEAPKFVVENTGKGSIIKVQADGAATAWMDNTLFVVLTEYPPAKGWIVKKSGEGYYTVGTLDGESGWVATEEEILGEGQRMAIQTLTGKDEELFRFIRVDL